MDARADDDASQQPAEESRPGCLSEPAAHLPGPVSSIASRSHLLRRAPGDHGHRPAEDAPVAGRLRSSAAGRGYTNRLKRTATDASRSCASSIAFEATYFERASASSGL